MRHCQEGSFVEAFTVEGSWVARLVEVGVEVDILVDHVVDMTVSVTVLLLV